MQRIVRLVHSIANIKKEHALRPFGGFAVAKSWTFERPTMCKSVGNKFASTRRECGLIFGHLDHFFAKRLVTEKEQSFHMNSNAKLTCPQLDRDMFAASSQDRESQQCADVREDELGSLVAL